LNSLLHGSTLSSALMRVYRVRVLAGTTEHTVVVRAQSLEESMEQALLALHLTHKDGAEDRSAGNK